MSSKLPFSCANLLCALAGALGLWLGFPNDFLSFPPLIFLWPAALTLQGLGAQSSAQAFRRGFITNALGMNAALYWLAFPIHQVGELPWIAAAGLSASVACCLAALFALFPTALFYARSFSRPALSLASAILFTLLELICATVTGFPWLPLSGALVVWPVLVQTAALVGHFGTTFFWLLGLESLLIATIPLPNGRPQTKKSRFLLTGTALLLLLSHLGYGLLTLQAAPIERNPQGSGSLAVLFVEGNFDQNLKWKPSLQRATVERYRSLTREGLSRMPNEKPLIIWPETAMPFFFERSPLLAEFVRDTARDAQLPLLFGTPGTSETPPPDGSASPVFNRAILLAPDGSTIGQYDKEHLVPFGEYTPPLLDLPFLKPLLQGVGVYTPGSSQAPLTFQSMRAGMLICYEGIFPWLAQERVSFGANILIDISNDAWFSRTPASRQHLYLTALRAVEQKRTILRGTNSGISAVIDSEGRMVTMGPLFTQGSIPARAKLNDELSFFHRAWPFELIVFLLAAALTLAALLRQQGCERTRKKR